MNRKLLLMVMTILLIVLPQTGMAGTSSLPNLEVLKQSYINYHDSGRYEADIKRVDAAALAFLKARIQHNPAKEKLAIVLDIDETSLSNYNDMMKMDFGGTLKEIEAAEIRGTDQAISPTLAIFQYAKAHDVAVFFITGRHVDEEAATIRNLQDMGYKNFNGITLKPLDYHEKSVVLYKSSARKAIMQQGYKIVLNIGDQQSDLLGGYAEKTFKLPNPYYFIP